MKRERVTKTQAAAILGCDPKRAGELMEKSEKGIPAYRCPHTGFYLADVAKLERWGRKYARFVNPPKVAPVRAARAEAAGDDDAA